jgi:hypothetical protein
MALESTIAHKSTHAAGAADAITPADIGAVALAPVANNSGLAPAALELRLVDEGLIGWDPVTEQDVYGPVAGVTALKMDDNLPQPWHVHAPDNFRTAIGAAPAADGVPSVARAAMELRDNEDPSGAALKCDGTLNTESPVDNPWSVSFPDKFRAAINTVRRRFDTDGEGQPDGAQGSVDQALQLWDAANGATALSIYDGEVSFGPDAEALNVPANFREAIGAIGGSSGSVDNAILRADGIGGATAQSSSISIEDATTLFQNNVAIVNKHQSQTDSSVVITPKGSGALILGAKPGSSPELRYAMVPNSALVNLWFVGLNGNPNVPLSLTPNATATEYRTSYGSLSTGGYESVITKNLDGSWTWTHQEKASPTHEITTRSDTSSIGTYPYPDHVVWPTAGITGGTLIAEGYFEPILGGDARGLYAIDLQLTRGLPEQVASGMQSVCVGSYNMAASDYGVAIGVLNNSDFIGGIAIGSTNNSINEGSIAIGTECVSEGQSSTALGSKTTASGDFSLAMGYRSSSDRYGQMAFANSRFAVDGDAQNSRFILRGQSTSTTARNLTLTGSSASGFLGIPVGKVMAMTINIAGISSLGAVAHYVRQYAVRNLLGTSTQVYAPVTIGTDFASGTSIALSVNDSNDTLRIVVTGTSGPTYWRWVATIDAVEIGI